jgi:hypothetical protein
MIALNHREALVSVWSMIAASSAPFLFASGQALILWAERYGQAPELARAAPYASKELDFCGQPEHVQKCADALGGT